LYECLGRTSRRTYQAGNVFGTSRLDIFSPLLRTGVRRDCGYRGIDRRCPWRWSSHILEMRRSGSRHWSWVNIRRTSQRFKGYNRIRDASRCSIRIDGDFTKSKKLCEQTTLAKPKAPPTDMVSFLWTSLGSLGNRFLACKSFSPRPADRPDAPLAIEVVPENCYMLSL
jgi:hypothetical protein